MLPRIQHIGTGKDQPQHTLGEKKERVRGGLQPQEPIQLLGNHIHSLSSDSLSTSFHFNKLFSLQKFYPLLDFLRGARTPVPETVTIPQLAFLMQTSIRSPFINSHRSSVGEIYTMPKNNGRSGAESITEAHQASFLFLCAQRTKKKGWLVN